MIHEIRADLRAGEEGRFIIADREARFKGAKRRDVDMLKTYSREQRRSGEASASVQAFLTGSISGDYRKANGERKSSLPRKRAKAGTRKGETRLGTYRRGGSRERERERASCAR